METRLRTFWKEILFLVLTTLVLYGSAIQFDFVNLDDSLLILDNEHVHNPSLVKVFTETASNDYIPLTLLAFAAQQKLFGFDPAVFHAVNIFFHVCNVILLFLITLQVLSGARLQSVFVTALFAIHPMHIESVAWVSELKDVLSGFFFLLALWIYLQRKSPWGWDWKLFGSFLCFLAGLFTKSILVVLPIVFLAVDWWRQRPSGKTMWLEKIPFFLMSFWVGAMNLSARSGERGDFAFQWAAPWEALVFSVSKLLLPLGLSPFYESNVTRVEWFQYLLFAAFLISLALFWHFRPQSRRLTVFLVFFFAVTLLPASKWLPFGSAFDFTNRASYLPAWGVYVLLVMMALAVPVPTVLRQALAVLMIGFYSAVSWNYLPTYENSESLWGRALQVHPDSGYAHQSLASHFLKTGQIDQAENSFLQSIPHLQKAESPLLGFTWSGLGRVSARKSRFEEALKFQAQAVEVLPARADFHYDLAILQAQVNQLDQAKRSLQKAIELDEEFMPAYVGMAKIALSQGNGPETLRLYSRALEIRPFDLQVRSDRALVYFQMKNYPKALGDLAEILKQNPKLKGIHWQISEVYKAMGDHQRASESAQKAMAGESH